MTNNVNNEEDELHFFSPKIRAPKVIDIAFTIVLAAGSALFYHSYVHGSHGQMAEQHYINEKEALKIQHKLLLKNIEHQENLNLRISDKYLDLDLLEEQAKRILGYKHPKDVNLQFE